MFWLASFAAAREVSASVVCCGLQLGRIGPPTAMKKFYAHAQDQPRHLLEPRFINPRAKFRDSSVFFGPLPENHEQLPDHLKLAKIL